MLVHQFLEQSCERAPDHVLVVDGGSRFSYADIEGMANRVAHTLLRHGVAPGERVALLEQNTHRYVAWYYGILKAGAVCVPLNSASDASMLEHFLTDSGARFLMVGPTLERLVARASQRLASVDVVFSCSLRELNTEREITCVTELEGSTARPSVPRRETDIAAIIYTSGSTGRPRGATLSHRGLVENTLAIAEYLALTSADRALQLLPFYYVYGKSVLNTHVAVGGSVVIENRFRYPNVALDTLEAEGCTGLSGVPSTFAILLNHSNIAERRLEKLRYVTQAGGAMSPALTQRLAEVVRARVFVMYGATEASARLSYLPPEELLEAVGSIGYPLRGVTLRPLREDGSECAVGEVGELVAQGPNIMTGYWNDPEETAKVLDERGYHTGDLGRIDERGRLWIVGRSKDMLKAGGHRISPREIEDELQRHPAVHEAAVIGVSDETLGEQIKAFVVLVLGKHLDNQELARFLSERLPTYKIPQLWSFVSELPKNESGKIMKQQLKAWG
jgi:acyl-CoA synthetase (AMP-forming)/AMP-acid ligase II